MFSKLFAVFLVHGSPCSRGLLGNLVCSNDLKCLIIADMYWFSSLLMSCYGLVHRALLNVCAFQWIEAALNCAPIVLSAVCTLAGCYTADYAATTSGLKLIHCPFLFVCTGLLCSKYSVPPNLLCACLKDCNVKVFGCAQLSFGSIQYYFQYFSLLFYRVSMI